jgi:hypothetical protein
MTKKPNFSLKLGPRAGPGSRTTESAGTGEHEQQFFTITGGHGQRAAKCHGLLTSKLCAPSARVLRPDLATP